MSGPQFWNYQLGEPILHDKNYQFTIFVNWLNDVETSEAEKNKKTKQNKKTVSKSHVWLPNRLWESLVLASGLKPKPNGPIYQNTIAKLIQSIDKRNFQVNGKSTFKKNLLLPVELI
jgi:predicted flavoprotein YhiN